MKPIAIILTDTHLKEENKETNISVYRQARMIAKDKNIGVIYHAGDIFESRKAQSESVLNTFKRILDEFNDDGMMLKAVPGNHDKTDYTNAASFLDPFSTHPAFELHRLPWQQKMYHPGNFSHPNISLTIAPFFSDQEYIHSLQLPLNPIEKNKYKRVLLTHIGMDGAIMNNGMAVKSKVSADLFKDFDLVLIGHYHDGFAYNEKIHYIGASLQHNFGERPDKGLTVLYDDLSFETIPLDFPKYLKYTVDVTQLTAKDIKDLQGEVNGKDRIRIELTGSDKDIRAFDKNRIIDLGIDVKVKEDIIVQEEVEHRVTPFTDLSLISSFERFSTKNELDQEQGSHYLKQALNIPTNV